MNRVFYALTNILSAVEPESLRDIKGPVAITLPVREIITLLVCAAATLLLLWYLVRLYRKRRERRPVIPERALTPEERALKRLNDPLLSEALERGDFKSFYFSVSDAIREYIAGRYDIEAMDLTTDELLSRLVNQNDSSVIFSAAEEFFAQGDLVKFAKFRPSVEEAEGSLRRAFDIVTTCENFFSEKARLETEKINKTENINRTGGQE